MKNNYDEIERFVYEIVDDKLEYVHAQTVANNFPYNSIEYIVAILHDLVEDEYIALDTLANKFNLSDDIINALYTITRQPGETYRQYIYRVKENEIAKSVKLADLEHNMERCKHDFNLSLLDRYERAYKILIEK